MAMATSMNEEDLIGAVEHLTPLLREHAPEAERARRLAAPVAEALQQAGFYRMFRPVSRGGFGYDPTREYRVAEALARVDSAAAWNVQVCNASELYGPWFSDEASREIFGTVDSVVAGAFFPKRRADRVERGYRVSGRTPFNSNAHGASWVLGLAEVYEDGAARLDASGAPVTLLTAIRQSECRIIDHWDTLGMRGTGSHDVEVVDVFVPEHRAVPFGPLESAAPAYDSPLAPLAVWATVGAHAAVALGVAQAALDDLLALADKVPAYTANALRDRPRVQLRVALAEGRLSGARTFFHAAFDEAWERASGKGCLDLATKAKCQLAGTMAAKTSAEVVELVHSCVGTAAIRNDQPFQKYFRDVHVITQHAFIAEERLESVGQIRLGAEPDWSFFAF